MKLCILSLVVVYFVVTSTSFHHGKIPRGEKYNSIPRLRSPVRGQRPNHRKLDVGVNVWRRDINRYVRVFEKTFVRRTSQMIYMKSRDEKLSHLTDIRPSVSAYDFKHNLVAIKARPDVTKPRLCLLLPISIASDYTTTVRDVLHRSLVSSTGLVGEFTMTGYGPMTKGEVDMLTVSYPQIVAFCRGKPRHQTDTVDIVNVMTAVDLHKTDFSDKVKVSVLTINGRVDIYLKNTLIS